MKILIADDEWIERKSMRKLIEENMSGMQIVGEAKHGREAVALTKDLQPDIILMDIKMPGMSGIEAVKAIKEKYPKIKIAMVSAFDSFEYAKEAMHYGIKDYILKPSDKKEVLEALERMKQEIESEVQQVKLSAESKSLTRLNFLQGLLSHPIDQSLMSDQKKLFPNLKTIFFLVIMSDELLNEEVQIEVQALIFDACIISNEADYMTICVMPSNHVENKEILTLSQQIHFTLGEGYYIGAGYARSKVEQAYKSFNEAYSASYKLKNDRQRAYGFLPQDNILNEEEIGHITALLEIGQVDEAYLFFIEHESYVREAHREKLYLHIKKKLSEADIDYSINTFTSLKTKTDWKQFFHMSAIEFQKIYQRNQSIEKVKQYIAEHYQKQMTLEEMSELVRLSPNYFSNLFKQQTGKTLTEYITMVRMKQARNFIIENKYSLKEISYLVGYKEPNYFSRVFKKYYKQSPKQFQKAIFK